MEQIEFVQKILDAGFAYESEGSVYFDVEKYNLKHNYGKLSGRNIEDMLETTRELDGQTEKRRSVDFALWKKASPEHIMRWKAPWSEGFPGWHLECSAMSTKYLGDRFDIHGGGMDLLFPHHESEIAQCQAAIGHESVKYWMHNNMITINGQKMGKSLGNFITLEEFFSGNHKELQQAYHPMTIRFFILQAHYRGTLDFSNEALQAADKGLKRLMAGVETLDKILKTLSPLSAEELTVPKESAVKELESACYAAMNDDFNTPILIAQLFEGARIINSVNDKKETLTPAELIAMKSIFDSFLFAILGMKNDKESDQGETLDGLMQLILAIRQKSRENKDWDTSDQIRNALQKLHIVVKDGKEGSSWGIE